MIVIMLKNLFALRRKNQKGQVAIFVALIFQVVFVFFALMINIGLLVHQKINLQQSTDLAAYYGAMKQAEMMNAMSHVNFQIRQAWKLLTWRYRILGTFGFVKTNSGTAQDFPFEQIRNPLRFEYHGTSDSRCTIDGQQLGVQDIPFFCVGHGGFSNWPGSNENNCQLDCNGFANARVIPQIQRPSTISTPFGGNVAGAVDSAVQQVNAELQRRCTMLGQVGANSLARFIAAYKNEIYTRTKTIEVLAKNLSLPANEFLDIEGNSINEASLTTFKNNLTEANLTGLNPTDFSTYNGLQHETCRFSNGREDGSTEFLKKIDFQFMNYFIQNCTFIGASGNKDYKPENVYMDNGDLGPAFTNVPANLRTLLQSMAGGTSATNESLHTVGYEKNPHCVEYYAVKASTTPQIPFLPISKIRLHAEAVAKPFGGSIGPWYGTKWPQGTPRSVFDPQQVETLVDRTLPTRDPSSITAGDITKSVRSQPNFSLFVGDAKGLSNSDYIAAFHSALAVRDIKDLDTDSITNRNTANQLINDPATGGWPNMNDWANVENSDVPDFRQYDSLASEPSVRGLELAAIAPNQFDITYYSIEPDFYNNYYVPLAKTGIDKLISKTGSDMQSQWLRADFGAVGMDVSNTNPEPPLTKRTFSVKDQILAKNRVLNAPITTTAGNPPNKPYVEVLDFLVTLQSSLLTGWTFNNYLDYGVFPDEAATSLDAEEGSMAFGKCKNDWNDSTSTDIFNSNNYQSPPNVDQKFPPVPGNCVTGGRTGYSVKLISPMIILENGPLSILNPLPNNFLNF